MRCAAWPGWRVGLLLFAVATSNSAATAGLLPVSGTMTTVTISAGFSSPDVVTIGGNPAGNTNTTQTLTNLNIPTGPPVSADPNSPVTFFNSSNNNLTSANFGAALLTDNPNPGAFLTFAGGTPGTGISQLINSDPSPGTAQLKIQFQSQWLVDAGGFGGPIYGGYNIPISGTVSTSVELILTLSVEIRDSANNVVLASVPFSIDKLITTPGDYSLLLSDSAQIQTGAIAAGDNVDINGTITFNATDAGAPSSINTADGLELFLADSPNPVPEPASLALLAVASGAWLGRRWHRRKQTAGSAA